jgi:hypothetical protein
LRVAAFSILLRQFLKPLCCCELITVVEIAAAIVEGMRAARRHACAGNSPWEQVNQVHFADGGLLDQAMKRAALGVK